MLVGTVKELKNGESRVGLTPAGVVALLDQGHEVLVETGAATASGFVDADYRSAGATIASTAREVWERCGLIVKVKEPIPDEFEHLTEKSVLFTYLHLAADERLTQVLLAKRVTAIAYETVELEDGSLPLLTPMSAVAGRMSLQVGAHYLERTHGGSGKLLGGVPGVAPATVTILGTGVVGTNAARMAWGLGAAVTLVGRNHSQLTALDDLYRGAIRTCFSTPFAVGQCVAESDLIIGAVAVTGARATKLVTRGMVKTMRPGSVLVDVAIDQGGCSETSRVTSHADPVYLEEGVIHYCVSNMPGAVPNTSTQALTNATLPHILKLADAGGIEALVHDRGLLKGLNTYQGEVTNAGVAASFGLQYVDPVTAVG